MERVAEGPAPFRSRLSHAQRTSRTLLNGGVAGCVAKTATAPLTRLTVLAQTGAISMSTSTQWRRSREATSCGNILRQVLRQEGVLSLWKGNICTCLHRLPSSAITFGMVEACSQFCPELSRQSCQLLPGAIASCVSVTACYPLEVIRTHQMVQRGPSGKISVLLQGLCHRGVGQVYRGLGMALLSTVPSVSIAFGTYRLLMTDCSVYQEGSRMRPLQGCLFGGISGVMGAAVCFPVDLLRRRLQVMIMDQNLPQRNWRAETRHIWHMHGLCGFYRGLTLEVTKVFPSCAVTFATYEWLRHL